MIKKNVFVVKYFFYRNSCFNSENRFYSLFFTVVIWQLFFLAMSGGYVYAGAAVCRTVDGSLISTSRNIEQKFLLILQECRELDGAMDDISEVTGVTVNSLQLTRGVVSSREQEGAVARQSGQLRSSVIFPVRHVVGGKADLRAQGFASTIHAVALEYNIDPLLLHAIAHVESRHNPDAISPAGARGIIQIMPATARRFGVTDPERELHDPLLNLRVGSAYLKVLQNLFGNDLPLVLAAYNAGEGAVLKYGRAVPPYRETQHYVRAVMEHYLKLKKL